MSANRRQGVGKRWLSASAGAIVLALVWTIAIPSVGDEGWPPTFSDPAPVQILGYDGDAMEPFLSRDGQILFFNNRNHPVELTDLHWAVRVDDLTFQYRGLVEGVNSDTLDGVATMSADSRFCFVSTRQYFQTYGSVYCGAWRDGRVDDVVLQVAASPGLLGRVVFDVEIAATGDSLIVADGRFAGEPVPRSADLRLARDGPEGFRLSPGDDDLFAAINTGTLEYAAALSDDGLELAFTRRVGRPPFAVARLWLARRPHADAPFASPVEIDAAEGFVEGPTFSSDGRLLYFHRRVGGRFEVWRVVRSAAQVTAD